LLYRFFVIEHARRKMHRNVTRHQTTEWVVQQLREAFPETVPYRYVVFDRDSKFDAEVATFLKATGQSPGRRVFNHAGRMASPKDGSADAAEKSWTTSLR